ncbi:MAG: LacI family DNA-binding transcriptional regulator [Puniceicoccales bacterium]
MKKRTSMRDIAQRAGVSVMTVSLAFRNSNRVSEKTRNRILELAKEMDFVRDPALSALVSYRHQDQKRKFTGSIAYLNNLDTPRITEINKHHRELFLGAKETAEQLGYQLEEFWLKDPDLENRLNRISQILSARGTLGLIVGPQQAPHTSLPLNWELFSNVQLFFSLESPRLHAISTDVYSAGQRVFSELCKLGYQRIGFVSDMQTDERVHNLYSASYFTSQYKLPPHCARLDPLILKKVEKEPLKKWFDEQKPDAVIVFMGYVIPFLQDKEFTNGKKIGIAAPYPQDEYPGIAHISIDRRVNGSQAMKLLATLIERNEKGIPEQPLTHSIIFDWNPAKSLKQVGSPIELIHPAQR